MSITAIDADLSIKIVQAMAQAIAEAQEQLTALDFDGGGWGPRGEYGQGHPDRRGPGRGFGCAHLVCGMAHHRENHSR